MRSLPLSIWLYQCPEDQKIPTGEIEDITTEDGKNAAAVALGRMGGKARAAAMTAKKRSDIAKKAALTRWRG